MHRNITIRDIIASVPHNTVNDAIWKQARGKGVHYVINARNELGYQIKIDVREPLLDQFAEDLDDV